MDGSEGAGTTYVPSPPEGFHQSAPQMPDLERLLDGPHAALSSWMPPHTPNGTVLEIATVLNSSIGMLLNERQLLPPTTLSNATPSLPWMMRLGSFGSIQTEWWSTCTPRSITLAVLPPSVDFIRLKELKYSVFGLSGATANELK